MMYSCLQFGYDERGMVVSRGGGGGGADCNDIHGSMCGVGVELLHYTLVELLHYTLFDFEIFFFSANIIILPHVISPCLLFNQTTGTGSNE